MSNTKSQTARNPCVVPYSQESNPGLVMHHYPFHVGDYIRATAHLDIVEDCIYRRLIDLYMETELPIPNETQQVIRRLRLGSSGLILETILKEFFTLEADNCWHNSRCDQEISEYKRLATVSRINGKLGGRPKKTQQVILDNPDLTQQEPSGLQPRTTNHEPIRDINSSATDVAVKYTKAFLSFWEIYPNRKNKGDAFKAFKKIKPIEYQNVKTGLEHAKQSAQWIKNNGEFIPHPASWLNARGWEDEVGQIPSGEFDIDLFMKNQAGVV